MDSPGAGVSVKGDPPRFRVTVAFVTDAPPAVVHPFKVPSGNRSRLPAVWAIAAWGGTMALEMSSANPKDSAFLENVIRRPFMIDAPV
ncbi:hypothetical protein [Novosphingobium sp. EMRT-2]|uniref:hypothetical protein n=2 Tax=unclassified Novosphingobium TaxID=2644732 RepID=UPI00143DC45F|nr:hypothetical protein [Novosphingobium sp. EMRT-2]